jgi:hypothetical protein
MKSYYELLGANADDDAEALKEAFRKAVKANHPDLHPSDPDAVERFREIVAANTLLRDAKLRATYDWFLQSFQLNLKGHQRRSDPPRQQRPLKGMRTIAVIAAVSALIMGYGLWATMPTSGNVDIDKGELAAAAGAVAEKHAAIVVAGGGENASRGAARTEILADVGAAASVPATNPQSVPGTVAPAVTPRLRSLSTLTTSRAQSALDASPARAASRRLTIDAVRLRQSDALLTISAGEVDSDAAVVVGGLPPGSTLSAGAPVGSNMWRLSTKDLGDVVLAPPPGFVGAMGLTLELRLADQAVVDHKALQLEWSAEDTLAPPKSQRFRAAEIALMKEKGAALIGIGNVGGARMMFRYAAEAGDPAAAFALAETFDPLVLMKLNTKGGITPNVGLAQTWYQKAKDLGSAVAPERLERLARLPE